MDEALTWQWHFLLPLVGIITGYVSHRHSPRLFFCTLMLIVWSDLCDIQICAGEIRGGKKVVQDKRVLPTLHILPRHSPLSISPSYSCPLYVLYSYMSSKRWTYNACTLSVIGLCCYSIVHEACIRSSIIPPLFLSHSSYPDIYCLCA